MTLAITVNNADYSENSIGWEAPTTLQPTTALFAMNGASGIKNLASSRRQPTTISGSPTFTPGVAGASLPFETLGANASLETYQIFPQKLTIMSLINLGAGQSTIIGMHDINSAALILGQRPTLLNNWLVCGGGADQITENVDNLVTGTWQIHMWQCDISTKSPALTYKNYTTGASGTSSGTFSQVYDPTQTFVLGGASDTAANSTYQAAVHLFWDDLLGADDLASSVAWLRQYAASYGVTA